MARSMMMVLPGGAFEGVHEVLREINDGSDRASVIVGGALVDEILSRVLRRFLRQDKKSLDDLFGPSGPLGSFSSRIALGYHLGCYGKEVRRDLDIVRKVRNQFAHSLTASFTTQSVRSSIKDLKLVERYAKDTTSADKARPEGYVAPANLMDWQAWVYLNDLEATLKDPRERFIGEVQVLAWALAATYPRRVTIGDLG